MGQGGRAYLVDELRHALRKDVIRQLLVLLKRIPPHVVIVFTTTVEGQERALRGFRRRFPAVIPLFRLDLARRDSAQPFAERAKAIAEREGLDGRRSSATSSWPKPTATTSAPCAGDRSRRNGVVTQPPATGRVSISFPRSFDLVSRDKRCERND